MPLEIKNRFSQKWVDEESEEGKNLYEEFFLNDNLQRNSLNLKSSYNKITNLNKVKDY